MGMRKWVVAVLLVPILVYSGLWPFEPVDASSLCVVENLYIDTEQEKIKLIGGDAEGIGATLPEAQRCMEQTAPGKLFLRQVKAVVLCGEAKQRVNLLELSEEIPLGAAVYCVDLTGDALMEEMDRLDKRGMLMETEKAKTLAQVKGRLLEARE